MSAPKKTAPSRARAPEIDSRPEADGRSSFTHVKGDAIVALVRRGNFQNVAAAAVGIGERTLHDWKEKGRADPESAYGHFVRDLDAALALAETDLVDVVRASADIEPADAKWLLERTRAHWRPKNETKLEGSLPDQIAALLDESDKGARKP